MIKNNAILTNAGIVGETDKGVADAMVTLDEKYSTYATPTPGINHGNHLPTQSN